MINFIPKTAQTGCSCPKGGCQCNPCTCKDCRCGK